jgi:cysteine desulfurase/selenocysteine lyase
VALFGWSCPTPDTRHVRRSLCTPRIPSREMQHPRRPRLYLDNAATSFPKPPGVYQAMLRYATENGAPARGRYAEAAEAGRLVHQCRERLCRLFNAASPDHMILTLNASDALNLAIKGVVNAHRHSNDPRRAHVITTWMDHNSVLRPFNALAEEGVAQTRVTADPATGLVNPDDIRRAIREAPADAKTVLVAVLHASNVTGTIQPVPAIGRICRELGVPLLVDAAQSAGHIPVDVEAMHADLLAVAGHKGLLGPTGTGALWIRPGIEHRMRTVREGGTGSRSELDTQPALMPDRFEPGSHNTMGAIGLSEGVAYLLDRTIADIRAHEETLMHAFTAALDLQPDGTIRGTRLRLLGPAHPAARVGVFSFVHDRLAPIELADRLEHDYGILSRAGLHCAPLAHRALGTDTDPSRLGAVRLSFGPFVTPDEAAYAGDALRTIARESATTDSPFDRVPVVV